MGKTVNISAVLHLTLWLNLVLLMATLPLLIFPFRPTTGTVSALGLPTHAGYDVPGQFMFASNTYCYIPLHAGKSIFKVVLRYMQTLIDIYVWLLEI